MHQPDSSHWTTRDILALAVIALCALIVMAALLRPGAGFESLLPLLVGAVVVVVHFYFDKIAR